MWASFEGAAGFDRYPALDKEIVVNLAQLFREISITGLIGLTATGKANQGGPGPIRKRASRAFVHATFSWVVEVCSRSWRCTVVRGTVVLRQLAEALPGIAVAQNGGTIEFERFASDVSAFEPRLGACRRDV